MKKQSLLLLAVLISCTGVAQNVGIGIVTPASKLHIKGSGDASQLIIDANSTQSNTHPLLKLRKSDGTDLMWIHSDDITNSFMGLNAGRVNNAGGGGTNNTFIGSGAGYSNTTGYRNTANGWGALYLNTTGYENTANGYEALYYNTAGVDNTANGFAALFLNSTGNFNTANGYGALGRNTTGGYNTANGWEALYANVTGTANTADGNGALQPNRTGSDNTANGYQALSNTISSLYNTAVGYNAGSTYDNGYNNVFLGANCDVNGAGYYNDIAIGQGVICTDVSQARIGNSATGSIGGYANWSNISDGRYKNDVQENVKGIDFIMKLRPVTYHLDVAGINQKLYAGRSKEEDGSMNASMKQAIAEKEKTLQTGFVAQEVEKAAEESGYDFSAVDKPKNDSGFYGLRYAEFVVPLVKGMQEQQKIIDTQKNDIETLKTQVAELTKTVNALMNK